MTLREDKLKQFEMALQKNSTFEKSKESKATLLVNKSDIHDAPFSRDELNTEESRIYLSSN